MLWYFGLFSAFSDITLVGSFEVSIDCGNLTKPVSGQISKWLTSRTWPSEQTTTPLLGSLRHRLEPHRAHVGTFRPPVCDLPDGVEYWEKFWDMSNPKGFVDSQWFWGLINLDHSTVLYYLEYSSVLLIVTEFCKFVSPLSPPGLKRLNPDWNPFMWCPSLPIVSINDWNLKPNKRQGVFHWLDLNRELNMPEPRGCIGIGIVKMEWFDFCFLHGWRPGLISGVFFFLASLTK